MIHIEQTEAILKQLNPEQAPLFGTMSPQQMVEHLLFLVEVSLGKYPQVLIIPEERAGKAKQYLIYTDNEMSEGIKLPAVNGMPESLQFPDLDTAKQQLWEAVSGYTTNTFPDTMHPVLGLLNQEEWIIFHNKHFTHHFKQFGLV